MLTLAQANLSWESLFQQVPLVVVGLGVAFFLFRYITAQHADRLKESREQAGEAVRVITEAHGRVEAAKDAQIKDLQAALQTERAERDRLLKVIEKVGGKAP